MNEAAAVAVFTKDLVGNRMAGPGIRAFHLARELAGYFPTTLIATLDGTPPPDDMRRIDRRAREATAALRQAKVVIGQPGRELLSLTGGSRKLVFDLFDPLILELSELFGPHPDLRQKFHRSREAARLRMALDRGDLLLSGFRRQRDFYAGLRASISAPPAGWLDRWIDLPFGIDPPPDKPAARSSPPTILWGGGVWEWLDSGTAVDALRLLRGRGIDTRLQFLGVSRPNDALRELVGLSVERVHDPGVEWREGWVPYGEHHLFVESARVALMLHRRTLEGEFSLRTRLFDAIRAATPVVTTAGGFASDLVEDEGVGIVVTPGSASEVADALAKLILDDDFHASCVSRLKAIQPRFLWPEVTRPLIDALRKWL